MQLLQVARLAHDFLALHQQHAGIVLGDKRRHEFGLLFIGVSLQNIHRQLQQLVAMGGIDVGCIQQRILHQADATVLARQAINAAEQRQHNACLLKGFAGTHRRTVVHAKHQVNLLSLVFVEPLLDRVIGCRFGPVALQGGNHLDAGVLGNGFPETVVTFDSR